jgi:hypothetical protein
MKKEKSRPFSPYSFPHQISRGKNVVVNGRRWKNPEKGKGGGRDKPPGVCRIREVVSVVQEVLTTNIKCFTTLGRKIFLDFFYRTNTYNIGTGT